MSIHTLLVPSDFSEPSGHAVAHALALARAHGARIELAHAYGAPAATLSPYGTVFPVDLMEGVRESAHAKLEAEAERLRAEGVEVETHLSKRTPQDVLSWLASEVGADLVVMGTRGFGGLKQVLLGSVAQHMVRAAPCPVMTVSAAPAHAGPARYARILVPTDFSTALEPTLAMARTLAGEGKDAAELWIGHALYVPREIQVHLEKSDEATRASLSRPLLADVEEIVERLVGEGVRARGELLTGRPEEAILETVERHGIDLIVMGTHGRSGLRQLLLGSVAEHVLRSASCPTVTVKPD